MTLPSKNGSLSHNSSRRLSESDSVLESLADCQSTSLAGSTWVTGLMARELLDRPFDKYARFCRTASFLSHRRIIRSCAFLCATPPRRLCVQNSQAQAPRFFRAYISGQPTSEYHQQPHWTGLAPASPRAGRGEAHRAADSKSQYVSQTLPPLECIDRSHMECGSVLLLLKCTGT